MELPLKSNLPDWTQSIEEISRGGWTVRLIHLTGASVEKNGVDLDETLREAEKAAKKMEKKLNDLKDEIGKGSGR